MGSRKYHYSFAELVDRLTIVGLKEIYAKEGKEKFEQEVEDLVHDIQLMIDEGVVVTGSIIRMIIILTQANLSVWVNEDAIRENETGMSDTEAAAKLTYTHKLNGTRSIAKTMIQNKIGGRVDPKINCLAENSAWDIKW